MTIFRPWEDPPVSKDQLGSGPSTSMTSMTSMNDDELLEVIVVDDEIDPSSSSSHTPISTTSDGDQSLDSPRGSTNRQCTRCECPNCLNGKDRSRSGVRIHVCHYTGCTKKYRKTSHLRAHLRSHEGWRPFVCTFHGCDRAFGRSDQLQRHVRAHTGERKHVCPHCQRRFARSDHLRQHIGRQHLQNLASNLVPSPPHIPPNHLIFPISPFYPPNRPFLNANFVSNPAGLYAFSHYHSGFLSIRT